MTQAVHIDTLKFARKLIDAGLDRTSAEAIADGLSDLDTSDIATKADIARLEAATQSEFKDVRAAIAQLAANTKTEMTALELRITDTLTRRIGFMLAVVAAVDIAARLIGH